MPKYLWKISFVLLMVILLISCASYSNKLLEASKRGDYLSAKKAIEEGADVNVRDIEGTAPLHHASYFGHIEIVKLLSGNGANINIKAYSGSGTPLHAATMNGNITIIKHLVENGANVNAKDDESATPIVFACWIGEIDVVKYLVKNGAEIDTKTSYGASLLYVSALSGKLELVKYFIERGANPNAYLHAGTSPLHVAVAVENFEMVKYLVNNGADLSPRLIGDFRLPICLNPPPLSEDDVDSIPLKKGQTPLDIAIDKKYKRISEFLKNAERNST